MSFLIKHSHSRKKWPSNSKNSKHIARKPSWEHLLDTSAFQVLNLQSHVKLSYWNGRHHGDVLWLTTTTENSNRWKELLIIVFVGLLLCHFCKRAHDLCEWGIARLWMILCHFCKCAHDLCKWGIAWLWMTCKCKVKILEKCKIAMI